MVETKLQNISGLCAASPDPCSSVARFPMTFPKHGIGMAHQEHLLVPSEADIVLARERCRAFATALGFSPIALSLIVTTISELLHNTLLYAHHGCLTVQHVEDGERTWLLFLRQDTGLGIPNIPKAMSRTYATAGGMNMGLSAVKRLIDEHSIGSEAERGTAITIIK